ncbi:hypothetical protein GCM10027516_39550 [Niabella aquatica]
MEATLVEFMFRLYILIVATFVTMAGMQIAGTLPPCNNLHEEYTLPKSTSHLLLSYTLLG